MKMDRKNIDDLFKTGLGGYKIQSPPDAWDRMNQALGHARYRKTIVLLRWMAATILIILAFGAGYFYANLNIGEPALIVNENGNSLKINPEFELIQYPDQSASQQMAPLIQFSDVELINEKEIQAHENLAGKEAGFEVILVDETSIKASSESIEVSYASNSEMIETVNSMTQLSVSQIESKNSNFLITINLKEAKVAQSNIALADKSNQNNLNDYYTPPKDVKTLKWAVGAQIAPTYSFRDISSNYGSGQAGKFDEIESYNNAEEAIMTYSGGLNIDYAINSKWSLKSGMYLSRIGQVNNDALQFKQENNAYVLFAINTSTGLINIAFERVPDEVKKITSPKDTINALNLDNVKVIQNFDLFEIPFMAKYHFLNKKLSLNIAGGLSPAYLVRNNTYLEVDATKYEIGDAANLNSLIVNSTIGLGIGYKITRTLTFSFEPTFKYSLSPINSNSDVYYHPYYVSWFTGINYKF